MSAPYNTSAWRSKFPAYSLITHIKRGRTKRLWLTIPLAVLHTFITRQNVRNSTTLLLSLHNQCICHIREGEDGEGEGEGEGERKRERERGEERREGRGREKEREGGREREIGI